MQLPNTSIINSIISRAQTDNNPDPEYFHLLRVADTMPDIWVNRSTAAYLLGLKKSTLEVWASTGNNKLAYEKCSRLCRYRLGEIKNYIKRSTIRNSQEVK